MQTVAGRAGGGSDAAQFGLECRGSIGDRPSQLLDVAEGQNLRLSVRSHADTTLVVMGPGGVLCDDDSGAGQNPLLDGFFPAGRYQVHVGAYGAGDQGAPFELDIESMSSATPLGSSASFETLVVPGRASAGGRAGGDALARSRFGRDARGYISENANHSLVVRRGGLYTIAVTSDADTTLVLTGADLTMADDDGGAGRNPLLETYLAPGVYSLFVGTYGRHDSGEPYRVSVSSADDHVAHSR